VYTAIEQAAGNPFWNEAAGAVDFLHYVQAQGKNSLDYLYVLLGWNSSTSSDDSIRSSALTFINNVHASFQNCQIVLLGLEMPSFKGLAANYGANADWTYYKAMSHVIRLNRLYEEIANATEKVSFVQVSGQFDTEHNMMTSERTVNVRNSTKERYQSNGVHPETSGYYQIADACYRDFIHKIQQ
jgi:lysophospholipase L1-like esterase